MSERGFFLNAVDPELPPCFDATCECGWRGRLGEGFGYVVGSNQPIAETVAAKLACPACGKSDRLARQLGLADFAARFRYAVEILGGWIPRRQDCTFSCRCEVPPTCRIAGGSFGSIYLKGSAYGDSKFCGNHELLRTSATVACLGCGETAKVGWLERHSIRYTDRQPWWPILRDRRWDDLRIDDGAGDPLAVARYEWAVDALPSLWREASKAGSVLFVGVVRDLIDPDREAGPTGFRVVYGQGCLRDADQVPLTHRGLPVQRAEGV